MCAPMSEKTPPAGWVVQIVVPARSASRGAEWIGATVPDAPSFKYFNAALAVAGEAIEAARQLAAAGDGSVVRALSSAEIAALGIKPGDVRPA
jgi:hypothetical protein